MNVLKCVRISYELSRKPHRKYSLIVVICCYSCLLYFSGNEMPYRHFNIYCRSWNRQVRINGWFEIRRKDDDIQKWPTASVLNCSDQKINSNSPTSAQCTHYTWEMNYQVIHLFIIFDFIFQETLYIFCKKQVFVWGMAQCNNSWWIELKKNTRLKQECFWAKGGNNDV